MDYIHTLLISEDDLNEHVEEISGEVREQQQGLSEEVQVKDVRLVSSKVLTQQ